MHGLCPTNRANKFAMDSILHAKHYEYTLGCGIGRLRAFFPSSTPAKDRGFSFKGLKSNILKMKTG
jgi:hypothetical protein